MLFALGVQLNVAVGCKPALVVNVAPFIPLFHVTDSCWLASASAEIIVKFIGAPAHAVVV